MNNKALLLDLDRVLNAHHNGGLSPPNPEDLQEDGLILHPFEWPDIVVRGTGVNIVPVLIDDSYSIFDRGNEKKLLDGVRIMIEALQAIARKQRETFFALTGFKETYFLGNVLDKTPEEIIAEIKCNHIGTPLVATALRLAMTANSAERDLCQAGIEVVVHPLLITDGLPEDDSEDPGEYAQTLGDHPNWRAWGMGITRDYPRRAQEDRENFTRLFNEMGIHKIVTPSADEVAAVLSSFSRSVSVV